MVQNLSFLTIGKDIYFEGEGVLYIPNIKYLQCIKVQMQLIVHFYRIDVVISDEMNKI